MNPLSIICGCVVVMIAVSVAEAGFKSNQRLRMCCARQKDADKECRRKFCDFGALVSDNLGILLSKCSKGSTLMRLWDCASSRVDHTQCCRQKNVQPQCLQYCNARKVVSADQTYLSCLSSFNSIRQCFEEHLESHPNIYGDQ